MSSQARRRATTRVCRCRKAVWFPHWEGGRNCEKDVECACRLPSAEFVAEVRPTASCADKRLVGRTSCQERRVAEVARAHVALRRAAAVQTRTSSAPVL